MDECNFFALTQSHVWMAFVFVIVAVEGLHNCVKQLFILTNTGAASELVYIILSHEV